MYFIIKRIFDFIVSLILLLVLSPMLIPIVLILRCTGEGEIFYLQNRVGFKNKIFRIWKFATMLKNSPNIGTGSRTVRDDPRVTWAGQFLRKTKINEIPQIINVLKGDMALVGPRPHMKVDFDQYPEHIRKRIYDITPGISGIGSVVFRDQESLFTWAREEYGIEPDVFDRDYIAPYKGELEVWYQDHMSIWTDFKILFMTGIVLVHDSEDLLFTFFPGLPRRNVLRQLKEDLIKIYD